MRLDEVRAIAERYQIGFDSLPENEITRRVERQDGYVDCFAAAPDGKCERARCLWRKECFAAARAVIPS